jgi:single-strand DNA-binding protein
MASYNRVILVGNLTRDVELRYIASGTAVTDIGLAVNDRVKKNDQWVDETTFVDITLWGRTAEVANEYLNKGSSVLIEGRLKLDSWENNEGQKRSKLKVIGERMQMLGGRGGGGSQSSRSQGDQSSYDDDGAYNQGGAGRPHSQPARSESAQPVGGQSAPPDDDIPF